MKKKNAEMTAKNLKIISQLFLEKNNVSEHKLARFSLDIYFPDDKIAFEYDGPDHYDKVANHFHYQYLKRHYLLLIVYLLTYHRIHLYLM